MGEPNALRHVGVQVMFFVYLQAGSRLICMQVCVAWVATGVRTCSIDCIASSAWLDIRGRFPIFVL